MDTNLEIIGHIHSEIQKRNGAPKQGHEGGVEAVIEMNEMFAKAMDGLYEGADVEILTWLHEADRSCMKVYPRGDKSRPIRGVFSTRSPDRPNPIGIHPVKITAIDGLKITVRPLEAIDGTPVIDIKSAYRP